MHLYLCIQGWGWKTIFPECVARVPVSLWGSGGWGSVRSTLRLQLRPFAAVRNRPREGRMAVPMASFAKGVSFGGFKCRVASCRVAGMALGEVPACFITCQKSHCVAGAILLRRFQKMRSSFQIDRSLARNIDFQVANCGVHKKTRRKTSILKLHSVKIGGSLARNARFDAPTCLVSSLWFSSGLAVSMGEVAKPILFHGVNLSCNVALRVRHFGDILMCLQMCRKTFCVACAILLRRFQKMRKHYTPHFTLRTLGLTFYTPHSTLYTLHSTLHTPHFTLYTPHCTLHTLHFTLCTLHSTLYTPHSPHSTLHTPHVTLYTPHCTLHTLHSALYTFSTLYTLLYTPHSTLYTLHFTLHALHSTPYTPHSRLYTAQSTLYTPHSTLYILHFTFTIYTLYTPHFTLHTLHSTLYTPNSTLHTPHFTLYTPHSRLYTPHSALYTLHCTLYTLQSTLYTSHFTLYTLHSTLHTLHSTLYTPHFTFHPLSHSTVYSALVRKQGKVQKTVQKMFRKSVLCDCIRVRAASCFQPGN